MPAAEAPSTAIASLVTSIFPRTDTSMVTLIKMNPLNGIHAERKAAIIRSLLIVLGLFLLLLPAAGLSGRFLVVNQPRKADVILVITGDADRGPARALELLNSGICKQGHHRRPRPAMNLCLDRDRIVAGIFQGIASICVDQYLSDRGTLD